MNDTKTKHYDDMEPRERDAWVAEFVFDVPVKWFPCWRDPECGAYHVQGNGPEDPDMSGFSGMAEPCYFPEGQDLSVKNDSSYWEIIPAYSTDPAADYLILKKSRDELTDARFVGDIGSFDQCLRSGIWAKRDLGRDHLIAAVDYQLHLLYEPGDYLHARWLVENGEPA